jgi:hypothetical protein
LFTFGEDMTEILDINQRRWKALQSVGENFTYRGLEPIAAIPAGVVVR